MSVSFFVGAICSWLPDVPHADGARRLALVNDYEKFSLEGNTNFVSCCLPAVMRQRTLVAYIFTEKRPMRGRAYRRHRLSSRQKIPMGLRFKILVTFALGLSILGSGAFGAQVSSPEARKIASVVQWLRAFTVVWVAVAAVTTVWVMVLFFIRIRRSRKRAQSGEKERSPTSPPHASDV